MTGLVAGSVAPDFEYFLRLQIKSEYSHTIDGMFWFDLPLALVLAFLFHSFVRNPLIGNLPSWFRKRLTVFSSFSWAAHFRKHIPAVLISLLLGIFSHLFWDAFTHQQGYFVLKIPFLQKAIQLFGYDVAIYHLFQHSCTVLGAIVILFAISRLPADPVSNGKMRPAYYGIILASTLLMIAAGYAAGKNYAVYGELIITGISGGLLGLILAGIALREKS